MDGEFTDDGIEWRMDDENIGVCPYCKRTLKDLSISGQGFCEEHSWVYANFTQPTREDDDDE